MKKKKKTNKIIKSNSKLNESIQSVSKQHQTAVIFRDIDLPAC